MTMNCHHLWFVLLFALCGCGGSSSPAPYYLGHVANLSGRDRSGEQAMYGIRLALEEATADFGDAFGGRPVHVRHTDTRGELDAYEAEAARLVAVSRVVGILGGVTAKEVAALERGQAPVLSPMGYVVPGSGGQAFCIGMQPTQQAITLFRFIVEDLKSRRIALVVDELREESPRFVAPFEKALRQWNAGKKDELHLATVRFGKEPKWAEVAASIAKADVAAIVFVGAGKDAGELRKAFAAKAPALVFAGSDGDFAAIGAGPGADAVHLATAFAVDADVPRTQQFAVRYRDAFKSEPTVHSALGYESLRLAVEAMRRAQPTLTHEKFREELRKLKDFAGLAGPLSVTVDNIVQRTLFVARYDGTNLVPVRRIAPQVEAQP